MYRRIGVRSIGRPRHRNVAFRFTHLNEVLWVAERLTVAMKPGNTGGARGPQLVRFRTRHLCFGEKGDWR